MPGFVLAGRWLFGKKLRRIADEIVNPYWASLQLDEKPADKS